MLNKELKYICNDEIIEELKKIKKESEIKIQRRFRKKSVRWYNIPCSFDIETTSTYIDGDKIAFPYEFSFAISDKVYLMRTMDDFIWICNTICDIFNLDEIHRIACYVHNLPFEFQFIRYEFEWLDVFSQDERRVMRGLTGLGIEFRDSAILSASSLELMAKSLHSHNIKKLVGDLDYKLTRTPITPLTKQEWQYCINDVEIIIAYIEEQLMEYGSIPNIPMTNTGRVRNYCREQCLYVHNEDGSRKLNSHGKPLRNWNYISRMNKEILTPEIYDWSKFAFRGGFTHANSRFVNWVIDNVYSFDLTSAYPSVMVCKEFPAGSPMKVSPRKKGTFLKYLGNYACLFFIEFINLERLEDAPDSYLSWIPEKMEGVNVSYDDNGRIIRADKLSLWMTEIDWSIVCDVYECEDYEFGRYMYIWEKDYLPKEIIKCILDFYKGKTELKGVNDRIVEYQRSKGMLNGIYGMEVQDVIKDNAVYMNHKWNKIESDLTTDDVNNKQGRFTYYPVGLWITAYCRRIVWDAILAAGYKRYVYTDTDSVKVINGEELIEWFEEYNNSIKEEMYKTMDRYGFNREMVEPCTIKGVKKLLGEFDYEGKYDKFKTLGAKRYMTMTETEYGRNIKCPLMIHKEYGDGVKFLDNGKAEIYEITVAGLPKSAISYFMEFEDPFEAFTNNCEVPANKSNKLLHTFIDDEMEGDITDYQGNTTHIKVKSSVHLEDLEFSMDMEDGFINWIKGIQSDEYNQWRIY